MWIPNRDYEYALTQEMIDTYLPKLKKGENFTYTSPKTELYEYNCVMWAIGKKDDWKEFQYDYTIVGYVKRFKYSNPEDYVNFFKEHGFKRCNSGNLKSGFEKIAIYLNQAGGFEHVALQLENGKWTSKLGDWEDIEHDSLKDLESVSYGKPKIFMQRKR